MAIALAIDSCGSSLPQACATAKVSWGLMRAPPGNTACLMALLSKAGPFADSCDFKACSKALSKCLIGDMFWPLKGINYFVKIRIRFNM